MRRSGTIVILGWLGVAFGTVPTLWLAYRAAFAAWMTAYPLVDNAAWSRRFNLLTLAFAAVLGVEIVAVVKLIRFQRRTRRHSTTSNAGTNTGPVASA